MTDNFRMINNELDYIVKQNTLTLLETAERHHSVLMPEVDIRFDLRGQSAGMVRFPGSGTPVIRYNRTLLEENERDFIDQTVPHEVAHVVARTIHGGRIRPHGPEWQSIMVTLGANPSRCHNYDTSRSIGRRVTRYPYHCDCREHMITRIRENRIRRGQKYHCRACGRQLQPGKPL